LNSNKKNADVLHSLKDNIILPDTITSYAVVPGKVLTKDNNDTSKAEQKCYEKGVGKLLHVAK
jgi:hypothetical protein